MKECVICDYQGKDNYCLKRHINRKHTPIECRVCGKDFTKHESGRTDDICGSECSKKNKQNWFKEYGQKPERKELNRLRANEYIARKKAEDPDWGLEPLIQRPCRYCSTVFPTRGNRKWYCNKRCSELWRLRQKRETTVKRIDERRTDKQCLVCKKTFTTSHHSVHNYCSYPCRVKNDNKKHSKTMSKLLHQALYRTIRKDGKSNIWTHFNFTIDEFRERFESLFTKGMKWENIGLWHIDHIKPKASFNQEQLADPTSEDFKKCWALENLQPLWSIDNLKKGSKEMEG